VMEAKPSWWGRLMPGARRSIVSSGLVAGVWALALGNLAFWAWVARRSRVRR
jgi:hypothetical protein